MKFNIGDKVKSVQYPIDIRGFIIDAKPLGARRPLHCWIYKIQTDTGLRMIGEGYLEIDKGWYRDQKIDSILKKIKTILSEE